MEQFRTVKPESSQDTQVLIAGGGPVGLTLALELGWHNIRCVLVEQREEFDGNPKAKTVHQRTLELFRRWGRDIPKKLRAAAPLGADFPAHILYITRLTGELIAALRNALPADSGNQFSPERTMRIPQCYLEPVLREEVRNLRTVEFRVGWRLDGFDQDEHGIRAEIVRLADNRRRQVRAAYLAGCDGGRSLVRKQLGISMRGAAASGEALGGVFRARELWSKIAFERAFHYNVINDDLPSLATVEPLELPDLWFWDLMRVDPQALDPAAVIRKLIGQPIAFDLLHVGPWTVHNALAERYRHGRVFLLGDAAHLQPPTGGYGMNGGVGDAVNFGWKLAAVLEGWGGERLLESYETERRQFHERTYEESAKNFDANDLLTPGLEHPLNGRSRREALAERILRTKPVNFKSIGVTLGYRYESSPVIVPDGTPATPYETSTYVPTARPGHRAPHYRLHDGTALFDHFGKGLTLLALKEMDTSTFEEAAFNLAVPLTILRRPDPNLRDLYESNFVLIRPDHHVAWRADAVPNNPDAILEIVCGQSIG